MIKVFKLTRRHVEKCDLKNEKLNQVKVFSTTTGHGSVGKIDFLECVMEIDEEKLKDIISRSCEYAKFKIGNVFKYGEVEIFPEHIKKLECLADSEFKNLLMNLKEGFIVLRKVD
ncbi:hypothetical protein FE773_08360 [Caminibacter mediatlanticus TB-2]|uniref:Uncharacterized protein n=1 Tax=Caminibacter mediatlanticus TB-2 TaxID=391592 RepID=A0ABX5VC47_9BACT|nr:formate hydrogenlyase maturation HycH family protein [Caminibacter mediatlanticus]QCT95202.1 hypothetical protein FE773_08360 [Caminibacter mediatlanticus TB-2]